MARDDHPSIYVTASEVEWREPQPGFWAKPLWSDPPTKRQVSIVRLTPGQRIPMHRHLGEELIFIIEGAIDDEHSTATAGNIACRPAGCVHTPGSKYGATLLVFTRGDSEPANVIGNAPPSITIDPATLEWASYGPGRAKMLWEDKPTERRLLMVQFPAGAKLPLHRHFGEELVYLIEGSNYDEAGVLETGNLSYRPNGCVHTVSTKNGFTALSLISGRTEPL